MAREPFSDGNGQTVGRVIAQGNHEELVSKAIYIDFTEEVRTQEQEEARLRQEEQKEEIIGETIIAPQLNMELSESQSFMEMQAVEGGMSSIPSDIRHSSITTDTLESETHGINVLEYKKKEQAKKWVLCIIVIFLSYDLLMVELIMV